LPRKSVNEIKSSWLLRFQETLASVSRKRNSLLFWKELEKELTLQEDPEGLEVILSNEERIRKSIDEDLYSLLGIQSEIMEAITALPERKLTELLCCHYIEGLTLEMTAERIGYSLRHTMRLHKKALELLVLPE